MRLELEAPCRYRPFEKGLYQVAPLLKPLNLGSTETDTHSMLFQIDQNWPEYRSSKKSALEDEPGKYIGFNRLDTKIFLDIARFIAQRLVAEYPQLFEIELRAEGLELVCRMNSERIEISQQVDPARIWQSLSLFVQEDLAIWRMESDEEWLAAVSILSPNHWAPEEKLGKSFAAVHGPVAGIKSINDRARQMVETMTTRGPFTRFAWGLSTDERLNHHPHPPRGVRSEDWHGRRFDPRNPLLFVRTERQCLIPFPSIKASLFTIRTSFEDCRRIKADLLACRALVSALESMTPESRIYKGLEASYQDILDWLTK